MGRERGQSLASLETPGPKALGRDWHSVPGQGCEEEQGDRGHKGASPWFSLVWAGAALSQGTWADQGQKVDSLPGGEERAAEDQGETSDPSSSRGLLVVKLVD